MSFHKFETPVYTMTSLKEENEDVYSGDGTKKDFMFTFPAQSSESTVVKVDGVVKTPGTDYTWASSGITFGTAPEAEAEISVTYTAITLDFDSCEYVAITYSAHGRELFTITYPDDEQITLNEYTLMWRLTQEQSSKLPYDGFRIQVSYGFNGDQIRFSSSVVTDATTIQTKKEVLG